MSSSDNNSSEDEKGHTLKKKSRKTPVKAVVGSSTNAGSRDGFKSKEFVPDDSSSEAESGSDDDKKSIKKEKTPVKAVVGSSTNAGSRAGFKSKESVSDDSSSEAESGSSSEAESGSDDDKKPIKKEKTPVKAVVGSSTNAGSRAGFKSKESVSDDSSSEAESGSDDDKKPIKKEVFSQLAENLLTYKEVKKIGPVSMDVLSSGNKLFIVRMPRGLIDPLSLINTKVTIGGGTRVCHMSVKEKNLEAVTFISSSDTPGPTLFLPDSNGELHQADGALLGQIHLREGINSEKKHTMIDIDSLRSIVHKPPEDIKERNFFKGNENSVSPRRSKKKSKRSMDNESDLTQTNSSDTPKMKKKKKKKIDECDSSFVESPNLSSSSKKKKKKRID